MPAAKSDRPQDPPAVVEADRPKARQDPVLIIDKTGVQVLIDGVRHRISDERGLCGIATRCLIAHQEGS